MDLLNDIEILPGATLERFRIVFLDKPSAMPRTYNEPQCPEVSLLTSSDLETSSQNYARSVVIQTSASSTAHDGRCVTTLKDISYCHPAFYPLCYPLLHFQGEQGWSLAMKEDLNITQMEYSSYMLQIRDPICKGNYQQFEINTRIEKDILLCANSLTQQYINDLYLSTENGRLDYIRFHQKQLKVELYQGLVDAVANMEEHLAGNFVVLPSTHTGSPRWYQSQFQDAMERCRHLGKPTFFITFTCNPKWPEISAAMKGFELPNYSNRPDLIARVFQLKLEEIMADIVNKQVFGTVTGYIYAMEWQKRGLPHAHILIFIRQEDAIYSTSDIDRVVCAEIPNPDRQAMLHKLVVQNMIHSPCGKYNKNRPCCKKSGLCERAYPKPFCSSTSVNEESYPNYRRRSPSEGGNSFVNDEKFGDLTITNEWIVPYNPYLLKKFEAHINVEICSSVKAIKYLHKYVFKGSDKAQIAVVPVNSDAVARNPITPSTTTTMLPKCVDEVAQYMDCRYIGPSEACHRLFGFPLHGAEPPVIRLQIHMPNYQQLYYEEGKERDAVDSPQTSQLLAYFKCVSDARKPGAEQPIAPFKSVLDLTYNELPQHYTFDAKTKTWKHRKKHMGNFPTIGRIYAITPNGRQKELYHLRSLLTIRKGMGSFEEVLTFNGTIHPTFQDVSRAMGLLQVDNEWREFLESAAATMTNIEKFSEFFVIVIFFNQPSNPTELWIQFREHLSYDFYHRRLQIQDELSFLGAAVESKGDYDASSRAYVQDDFDRALYAIEDILGRPTYHTNLQAALLPQPTKRRNQLHQLQHIIHNH